MDNSGAQNVGSIIRFSGGFSHPGNAGHLDFSKTSGVALGKIGKCFTFVLNHLMPSPPSKVLPSLFPYHQELVPDLADLPVPLNVASLNVTQHFRLSSAQLGPVFRFPFH